MTVRLVIFDYDQTLVESLEAFRFSLNLARTMYGAKPLSRSEFLSMFFSDSLSNAIPKGVSPEDFWEIFLRAYELSHPLPKLRSEARRALSEIKSRGLLTALITGRKCSHSTLGRELRALGLWELFDTIVTGLDWEAYDYVFSKVRGLEMILKELEVRPNQAVMVGDYRADIVSAKEVGIIAVGLATTRYTSLKLIEWGADIVIRSLDELIRVLEAEGLL